MTRFRATSDGNVPFTPEEEAEFNARELAWKEEHNSRLASEIRGQRDALLMSSDWTQINDAPVNKVVWAVYRQALRDITSQPGFPLNIVWPTKP
jgi:hypothetical protein